MSERRLGGIVRLQVQRSIVAHQGVGYDPSPILAVKEAAIGPHGMSGVHEGWHLLDVHHAAHPSGRGRGRRTLSIGFTGHYRAIADRFGEVAFGVGGENIIVDFDGGLSERDLDGILVILGAAGEVALTGARVADPCVEFASFLLGLDEVADAEEITAEMDFLGGGTRGYILDGSLLDRPVPVTVGDEVVLRI